MFSSLAPTRVLAWGLSRSSPLSSHTTTSSSRPSPDADKEAAAPFQANGLPVLPLVLDITSDESIQATARTLGAEFGPLDVLVSNNTISSFGIESLRERKQTITTQISSAPPSTDTFILAKTPYSRRVVFISSTLGNLWFFARGNGFGVYTHNQAVLHYATEHEKNTCWMFNIADLGYYCGTKLNGFQGTAAPGLGAISACRLSTIVEDGETGTLAKVNVLF